MMNIMENIFFKKLIMFKIIIKLEIKIKITILQYFIKYLLI